VPHRKLAAFLLLLLAVAPAARGVFQQPTAASPSVFDAVPEWRERDGWQRPQEVMDELEIGAGDVVADIGAGGGYFSFYLGERVGAGGKVYAQDIDGAELGKVRKLARKHGYPQIETIKGDRDDPRLPPASLDVALILNAYHEMREYDAMLRGVHRALKPGGLLAIIDKEAKAGDSRSAYYTRHAIPQEYVREDAARNGFRFLRQPRGFRNEGRDWFFLVFQKE
jgi:predicted methyltransferase